MSESNRTHLQVNRDLLAEFAAVLGGARWDVALLQESPPRWSQALARACRASGHLVRTSRNSFPALRALAARSNPDLIASNEGGSNLTLARDARIAERRELELRPGPWPERRTMAFTRLARDAHGDAEVCVANVHASAGRRHRAIAEEEVRVAAEHACEWAGSTPLVFGGDLNVRPRDSALYERLERELGLRAPTAPDSLDHLLARGLAVLAPPSAWLPERREVRCRGLAIRLSDHDPVEAMFGA